ncbi:glutathione peroxidase gpx1, partial [Aspergillus fumigatus]
DDASFARVWKAQLAQIAIPFMGLPGLTVTTGLVGRVPVGVQVVSGRYREDLCLAAAMSAIYEFSANSLAGEPVPMRRFEGQVMLIVNTASACGFTSQYKGLQELHQKLSPRGLAVLGFPCNQFGGQEPGDAKQIEEFCESNYAVTFPMFAKID